jgi:hypothetical protein
VPIVIPAGSAAASVWSSAGFRLPPELAQGAQFFQKPIVRARPPWRRLVVDRKGFRLTGCDREVGADGAVVAAGL